MLHVVLDRQEKSKTILEKAFFFIFWRFYLFSDFVLLNFKIGPSERWKFFSWNRSYRVSKIENFMLMSKKQTCLSDKMPPPPKIIIKKLFSNFVKSHFFVFQLYYYSRPMWTMGVISPTFQFLFIWRLIILYSGKSKLKFE